MKTIIVSRTDKIGDLVLSIPSFFMVRKMYPFVKLIVLVRNYNYDIVKNLPYVDEVIKIDDYQPVQLKQKILAYHADAFVALYTNAFIAQLARASQARVRIAPWSSLSSFFSYNKGIRQKRSQSVKNEAYYNLDLIRKLNGQLFDENFEINCTIFYQAKHKECADTFLKQHHISSPILLMNPFTGGSAKNITDEQYQQVIKLVLGQRPDIHIIVTVHRTDYDRGAVLVKPFSSVSLFCNDNELLNLVALIDRADLYLGGSTGPTHIAGSLNKKIVAVYPNKKSQHPTRWGVLNQNVSYIIPDLNNANEDYNEIYFQSYDEKVQNHLVETILSLI